MPYNCAMVGGGRDALIGQAYRTSIAPQDAPVPERPAMYERQVRRCISYVFVTL